MVCVLLVATPPAVRAQDAPASATTLGAPSTPAAPATGDQAPTGTSQTTDTRSAAAKPGASKVCFKLAMRCVDAKPPRGKTGSASKDSPAAQQPLNLNAPDIRTVVPPEELKEPLPASEQAFEEQEADTVQIKGESNAPDVPGGFGALWWALNHPSQAWRIVAPAE
jgi:hypothetical protein